MVPSTDESPRKDMHAEQRTNPQHYGQYVWHGRQRRQYRQRAGRRERWRLDAFERNRTAHEVHRAGEEVDRLRRRQFGVRAAFDRSGADLREFTAGGRRAIQYRVHLGLRANNRLTGHRRTHAAAGVHRRRAGHEDPVLHRFPPHRRGDVLCDGAATRMARVPYRLCAGDHRFERLTHLLRFDAGRRDHR